MKSTAQKILLRALQQPTFYDHPVEQVELIETHISWVFLAGDYVYKLKKPVDFGFLDFSTLEKRRCCCEAELRLNRRFAPQLYLQVVSIGGAPEAPTLHGQPALEYAVKMRRFDQHAQLDRLLEAGELEIGQIEAFADLIAELHRSAPVATAAQPFGSCPAILAPIAENFAQIRPLLCAQEQQQLHELENWSNNHGTDLQQRFRQRKAAGMIRECHGDLHLANMAWYEGGPILFDGIEFNANLRWIDLCNDIAFLVMDLDDRGQPQLGWRFLNRYLQQLGDYPGLRLLRFYQVYRAMVRAKVLCLRLNQPGVTDSEREQDLRLYHSYLALAGSYTRPRRGKLLITHGLSGSGKTSFARELAAHFGAIHLQSDRERKRLHGFAGAADSGSSVGGGIYSAAATAATYRRLLELAELVLLAGYPVIIDATFLQRQQRELFRKLAGKRQVPLLILDFPVADDELRRRIEQRTAGGGDVSEATLEVLNRQIRTEEPLTAEERPAVIKLSPESRPKQLAMKLAES